MKGCDVCCTEQERWRGGKVRGAAVCLPISPLSSLQPDQGVGAVQTSAAGLPVPCCASAVFRWLRRARGHLRPLALPEECVVRGSYQILT